ncbi:MAG: DedA family protein [Bacteroidaceae bacterium]|nr:DedA family protein [Bacteroidaceae bacterium]
MEEFIVNLTGGALDNLNYFWIIVFMTIESSFIPFPSEVVMIPAAYMAAAEGQMSIPMIITCGTIGALFGALINYALAYYLGRPIVYRFANSRFGHMCLIDQEKVEKAEAYFYKHGVISTLIGRLIPAIRQLISIPAGLSKMSIWKFMIYTCLGAGIWNAVLVGIGLVFHSQIGKEELIAKISHYSHIIGYTAIALVIALIIFFIYQGTKKSK